MWLTREQAVARARRSGSWGFHEATRGWVLASDREVHALIDRCEVFTDFAPCEHSGRMVARSHYKVPFVRYVWIPDDTG